ncbi:hypothetical protein CLV47_101370 [Antricoccus suffuscus]|uniref:MaoC dehydratase-like protein n=1 Tax=Antricoccus suffuscus TaxID=1629062 RepID=A0A2T1A6K7_9ACTN|nr:hypothetical protein [Antricoccus suffuscus]PRZ44245.1 hypothetical protein CLV47_101370 [Antricoccus suffuscus]
MSIEQNVIAGMTRRPRNLHQGKPGSIHDDSTARKLGFRGGTIAGSYHMEQAVPLVAHHLGATPEEWFNSGTMAAYFLQPTVDDQQVTAFLSPDAGSDANRADLWMETADGGRVFEGSASVGEPDGPSALAAKMNSRGADERRILAAIEPGEELDLGEIVAKGESQRNRLAQGLMAEPLPWYRGESPWGGAIASPVVEVGFTFENVKQEIIQRRGPGVVGLYGAIEVRHFGEPLLLDESYRVTSTVRDMGCTPKTEYMWTETVASRAGRPVLSVLMMSRVMKASSELYA